MNPDLIFKKLVADLKLKVTSFGDFIGIIQQNEIEGVYLAGGAIRNVLVDPDLPTKDLDIFISPCAFDILRDHLQRNGNLARNQFQTYRWHAHVDRGFYYDIIVIPEFYNGLWKCRNIIDALNQFDITANALAFDLLNGAFYNPQNGLLDIEQKILRAVRFDYPEIPVSKKIFLSRNTVLWFRYRHYATKLNFSIDPITAFWLQENAFRGESMAEFTQHFFKPSLGA